MMPTENTMPTDNMAGVEDSKPLLDKKKIILLVAVTLVALGAATFALLYQGPGQDVPESQEPQMDFAADGSKLAEIQILVTQGGLTRQQYEKVYSVLNKQLLEMEPESRYFVYVEDSLTSATSKGGDSAYDNVTINTVADGDSAEVIEDELENTGREEMEMTDTVVFTMRSESGAEYKVSVYTGGSVTTADTTIEKQQ